MTGRIPPPYITALLNLKSGYSASQTLHDHVIDLSSDFVVWFLLPYVVILL